MNEEQVTTGRRVNRRYSAEDRVRLIGEHASSGLTKKAFCEQQGINVGTFMGWRNLPTAKNASSVFAQVEVPADTTAAVEIMFPNGARVGIRHQGGSDELIALVRGVAGAA